LTAAQLALATTEARMKNSSVAPSARGSVGINDLAPPDAAPEEVLKNLIHQRMDEASRLGRLLITYGENHDEVTKSRTFIASMDRQIQQLYAQINSGAGSANVSALAASLQSLRTNEATIRKMYEDLQKEVQEVGEKNWQILNLRSEADKLQSELNEIKSTIERLTVEEAVGGRLAVINYGELPRHPDKDRRAALAGAGGFGGAVLGFAIIALWGLLDGRMRQIADARSQLPRFSKLLGVLPSLPENLSDPAQSAIAAHCVHQIRTLLQIQQGANGHRVLAVTSPSPGDGKTSLTIALGLSFAASGAKTLLIDCDMYGRRLTARLTSSGVRKLGQILLYNRRISDEQLSQALERARCAGRKLGETLIDMHAVNEKDVAHALGVQARMDAGLFGAIRGDQLADCVLRTGVSNLHLMPLGTDDPRQAALITPISMRPILDEAARQFDVVLVDTGPILGSSEAAVIASEVDGVVLTISRGGQRNLAQNAVNYLNSMNAHLEGIVFNRARPDDILRSGYSSSVSMSPGEKDKPEKTHEATTAGAGHWPKRLGPVAHAVSSESPTLRPPGDEKNS
jgi:Mrp family chromosome partitioning ATPase/archaellum component FlaC